MRAELKKAIEDTELAQVYTFEGESASTISAGKHYLWSLEESDVCIFLIDNADGIGEDVQKQIDLAVKNKIKSIYYFCDENESKKTPLEESLMGSEYAKSRTVHKFADLSAEGAKALIDDIVGVYHYYCVGKFIDRETSEDAFQSLKLESLKKHDVNILSKNILNNIDKCKHYIFQLLLGKMHDPDFKGENSSELDQWGVKFLQIMFEGDSIRTFNTSLFLNDLEDRVNKEYFKIIQMRWSAIQAYFSGNLNETMN